MTVLGGPSLGRRPLETGVVLPPSVPRTVDPDPGVVGKRTGQASYTTPRPYGLKDDTTSYGCRTMPFDSSHDFRRRFHSPKETPPVP